MTCSGLEPGFPSLAQSYVLHGSITIPAALLASHQVKQLSQDLPSILSLLQLCTCGDQDSPSPGSVSPPLLTMPLISGTF